MNNRILIFPSGMFSIRDGKYIEYGNGHVVRCINLAKEIIHHEPEIEVTLAVSGPEAQAARRITAKNVSLIDIPEVNGYSPFWQHSHRLRFETNLVRFLDPSVVVSDTHSDALVAAKYNSCKCVAILDLPPIEYFHIYSLLADLIFVPILEEQYSVPSSLQANRSKIHYVGPILDTQSIQQANARSKTELQKELGMEMNFIMVYVSRIHKDRELFIRYVVESYRRIQEAYPRLGLVLIGPGAVDDAKKEGVIGFEFVEDIHKYMKASSVLITRSPISAMEAMMMGKKPIIIPIPSDLNQSTMARSLTFYSTRYLPMETLNTTQLTTLIFESIGEQEKQVGDQDLFSALGGTSLVSNKILELAHDS